MELESTKKAKLNTTVSRSLLSIVWILIGLVMGAGLSFAAHEADPGSGFSVPNQIYATADQAIATLEPLSQQSDAGPNVFYQLGLAYGQKGEYEKAAASLKTAVKLDPEKGLAWHYLALTLVQLHRYEEALQASETAIRLDPENEIIWSGQVSILMQMNRMDAAGAALSQGFKYVPKSYRLWNVLGIYDLNLKHFDLAEQSSRPPRRSMDRRSTVGAISAPRKPARGSSMRRWTISRKRWRSIPTIARR